jgi:hypothetical protein
MATLKDFEMNTVKEYQASYTVLKDGEIIRKFNASLYAWQETFRQVFGPGSHADSMIQEWNGKSQIFVDPVHWDNPTCCAACREEAKRIINQHQLIS